MATVITAETPDIQTPATEIDQFNFSPGTNHGDQSGIELQSTLRWNEPEENQSLLPPTDTGKDAWMFLGAGFLSEVMVWGKCLVARMAVEFRERLFELRRY